VQPSALDDEDSSRIVRAIEREGRRVDILDVTTDVGIPTYVALATKPDGTDVVFGSAAHICPRRAAYKALSEVSQILYWKDRVTPNPELAEWLRIANTQSPDFEWLLPSGIIPPSPARRVDTIQAIAECVERLRDVGVEAYWIDLTRPEVGVPVVRTIAPGLRTPWARFAPGRLYDTPVRLGWQSTVSSEASLNPIHCMV
jgi:ribosomal protein S12 methylthiotransferase accessory factor